MLTYVISTKTYADPESVVIGGPTLTVFFSWKGREDPNTTISGHHRPASETPLKYGFSLACRWWPLWFFRRSGPALLRNSIFLWFLRGGGGPDPCPPFWIRACQVSWAGSFYNGYSAHKSNLDLFLQFATSSSCKFWLRFRLNVTVNLDSCIIISWGYAVDILTSLNILGKIPKLSG